MLYISDAQHLRADWRVSRPSGISVLNDRSNVLDGGLLSGRIHKLSMEDRITKCFNVLLRSFQSSQSRVNPRKRFLYGGYDPLLFS